MHPNKNEIYGIVVLLLTLVFIEATPDTPINAILSVAFAVVGIVALSVGYNQHFKKKRGVKRRR